MNQTANYQLSQWESTDRILMSDFNSDNAKIDAALKTNADNIAALEAVKGNCHVSYHTYVGTGAYSSTDPTSLTFPELPDLVIIAGENARYGLFCPRVNYGVCVAAGSASGSLAMTTSGSTISRYHDTSPYTQLNGEGVLYHVYAFTRADA